MTTIAFPIKERTQIELEKYAKEQNLTTDEVLNRAIERFLLEERMSVIQRRLQPLINQSGYKTEEDIYNDIS